MLTDRFEFIEKDRLIIARFPILIYETGNKVDKSPNSERVYWKSGADKRA